MSHHARATLEPGEVVHVVSWSEKPVLPGYSACTVHLEAASAPGVRGFVVEYAGLCGPHAPYEFPKVEPVHVGQLGKITRGPKRTRFFRFSR